MYQGIYMHPEKGDLYYFVNGNVKEMGLFQYTDGNYYVSQWNGLIVTAENYTQYGLGKYYVWKKDASASDIANGWYYFGEDGAMLQGIHVHPEKGDLYYFVNGKVKEMGLFKYTDGNYYIAQYDGKIITSENYTSRGPGKYYVWKKDASASDIVDGWYFFGKDGAMLQGICEHPVKGGLYYFVNGQVKEMGLFKYTDGNYYIAQYDGKIITSENYTKYAPGKYYVWKIHESASDIKADWYYFGQDGAMLQGVHMHPEKNDWFYFENGKSKEIGLFKASDGNYYYAQAGGKLVTSENYTNYGTPGKYYVWKIHESANDIKAGWYFFNAEGKMIIE
jgi:glucan-binding YG repeat protein